MLGEEHKVTLDLLNKLRIHLHEGSTDYGGGLDNYQQELRVQENVLGKIHPHTLATITNMAGAYTNMDEIAKAKEMYRIALDGNEKSLGKGRQRTKDCPFNMAGLYHELKLNNKGKTKDLVARYPHLTGGNTWRAVYIRAFIV